MKPWPATFAPPVLVFIATTAWAQRDPTDPPGPTSEPVISNTRELVRDELPASVPVRSIVTVDPTSSAPVPGGSPELSPPTLDILRATLQTSSTGTAISASAAPFALAGFTTPVLNEMRLEVHAGGDQSRWGFQLSTCLKHSKDDQQILAPSTVTSINDKCETSAVDEWIPMLATLDALKSLLVQAGVQVRDRNSVERQDHYMAYVVTAWDNAARSPGSAIPELLRTRGDQLTAELLAKLKQHLVSVGDCAAKEYSQRRFAAYPRAVILRVKAGMDIFPIVHEPAVMDSTTNLFVDPSPDTLAGYVAGLDLGYFPRRDLGIWASGAVSSKQAKLATGNLRPRLGGGLNIAMNHPVGKIEDDGFQSGVAFGAFVRFTSCLSSSGCDETIVSFSDPVEMAHLLSIGAFVDIRATSKIQVRVALPMDYYRLHSAPSGSDGSKTITQWIPTLSLTVATWGLN